MDVMTDENLIKLANATTESLHKQGELEEYLAFLWKQIANLDSDWVEYLSDDITEMLNEES